MTIPPINPFAGMASSGLHDRKAIEQEREQNKTLTKLEQRATGDAEADALESSADRDADGRQNWNRPGSSPDKTAISETDEPGPTAPRHSRDPYHERGNRLDLDG
jgi:hypothetical protein